MNYHLCVLSSECAVFVVNVLLLLHVVVKCCSSKTFVMKYCVHTCCAIYLTSPWRVLPTLYFVGAHQCWRVCEITVCSLYFFFHTFCCSSQFLVLLLSRSFATLMLIVCSRDIMAAIILYFFFHTFCHSALFLVLLASCHFASLTLILMFAMVTYRLPPFHTFFFHTFCDSVQFPAVLLSCGFANLMLILLFAVMT